MNSHRIAIVCMMVVLLTNAPLRADDDAQPGTQWIGILKGSKIEKRKVKSFSTDARLMISSRIDRDFSGQLWVDGGRTRVAIEGLIDSNGRVRFTIVRKIKGNHIPNDLIGNLEFDGTVQNKQLNGHLTVAVNKPRWGTLETKLKE